MSYVIRKSSTGTPVKTMGGDTCYWDSKDEAEMMAERWSEMFPGSYTVEPAEEQHEENKPTRKDESKIGALEASRDFDPSPDNN